MQFNGKLDHSYNSYEITVLNLASMGLHMERCFSKILFGPFYMEIQHEISCCESMAVYI